VPRVDAGAVAQVARPAKRQSACASPSAVGEGIVGYDTHHRAEVVKASSISPKNLKAMLKRTKNYRSVAVNDFGREKFTWDVTDVGCRSEATIHHVGLSPSLSRWVTGVSVGLRRQAIAFRRPRRSANLRGRYVYVRVGRLRRWAPVLVISVERIGACAYCWACNVPPQIGHMISRADGPNRVCNLTTPK
jgi:hypothetical protein